MTGMQSRTIDVYKRQELQTLTEETGMFGKITDESIEAGRGQTYSSSRAMQDPLMGLELPREPASGNEAVSYTHLIVTRCEC